MNRFSAEHSKAGATKWNDENCFVIETVSRLWKMIFFVSWGIIMPILLPPTLSLWMRCNICTFFLFDTLSFFRLQLYELVEHKVQGDGNCQVGFPFITVYSCISKFKCDSSCRFLLFSWIRTFFDVRVVVFFFVGGRGETI